MYNTEFASIKSYTLGGNTINQEISIVKTGETYSET